CGVSSFLAFRMRFFCNTAQVSRAGTGATSLDRSAQPMRVPTGQCDLMKPMMADTAGPSCLKNPCAPCALQGLELGSPVVLIHCSRALPRDHPAKMPAALGSVNWQISRLWWMTRVGGSLSGDPSVGITLE